MLVDEKPPLDENLLMHFGIKGMHWGVRKKKEESVEKTKRPTPLSSTKQPKPEVKKYFGLTKKQAIVGASVALGIGVGYAILKRNTNIKASELRKLHLQDGFHKSTLFSGKTLSEKIIATEARSNHPTTFPLGHEFSRISQQIETELRNGAYATYTKQDAARYASSWGGHNTHQIKIKALGEIKTPSLRERFSTMAGLVDRTHPDLGGRTMRQWLVDKQTTKSAKDWVKQASAEELGKYQYSNMTGEVWERHPVGKTYIKELRNKGYSAMTDDRDTGSLADSATVLINKNMFKITSAKKLSASEIEAARQEYMELFLS